ncbi:outer dynein arm-docking complex subunit 4-like [Coccinella septempunctata]|uniref:outer dynein arm-docking complex subunit 4-like n=1 Tax=Coccinella septempunctata TaxID=41139 RepID=UPI001D081D96|nr:outer dynein arm-docking complex subunit 4-like [Coccinella septempunctata]
MPLDKPDIYNALCVYRELGLKFGRLEKYEKSLPYFDEALQRSPQDVRALLGRARYRAQACKYNDALKDLATLKASDPENIYVFATECLVKYLCCQFEQAMVDNLNKIPIRKKPDNFVLGTMHCEDAIRNNVGSRAGHPLRDHFLIIRKLAWKRNFEKSKPYQPISKFKKKRKELKDEQMTNQLAAPRIKLDIPGDHKPKKDHKKSINSANLASISSSKKLDEVGHSLLNEGSSIEESLHSVVDINEKIPPMREYPFRPIQRYTTNIRNLMSERYLDKMFHDKSFLQRMKVDPAVKSPNDNGVKRIEGLVKKSSKYIHYNQELLRARRPFFLLRLQDAKAGGKLAERQLERERTMMKYCETEAQSTIERIKQAVKEQKLRQTIELAEKMYLFCEATPKKSLPNRNAYLIQLYTLVRDGFYGAKTIRSSMSEEQKYTRVAIFLGLPVDKQGSADSLVVQFRAHFLDKKKQCRIIVERVRNATCREELVWLYHELSRLHFDQKQYELSKAYATKCLREAYILKDDKWTVNAMFLMIRVQVLNRNKNGARIELRNCKKVAIKIPDEKMEDFIALCIKILNDTPMEGVQPTKMLEIRTKNIMKLITSDQMRMKAELIFQRINALPPCKRMSVLPGIHYPEIPTQKEPQDKASKEGQTRAKIPSRRKTGENRRGMNFLQLIQYHVDT